VSVARELLSRDTVLRASGSGSIHLSGDPTPSRDDRNLTQALKVCRGHRGVRFLDHLIIGKSLPFSFKAAGLL